MDKNIFTTRETAQYLGISRSTVYRMEKQGLINSTKTPGGHRRFNKGIIEEYLKQSKGIKAPQNPSLYKTKLTKTKQVKAFFRKKKIEIYNSDIFEISCIKNDSIDLIITSPPYNLDIQYNAHKDTMDYDEYLLFTKKWLSKVYKLIKSDGRLCLNIPLDKNKGGQQSVCADITTIAKKIGFQYHSTVIWNEQNISRRTAWGSWLSASAPYVIAPVEVIIILYKDSWKKTTSKTRKSDIVKAEFMEWTNGVWNFNGESKKRVGHPAPFPIELPYRCIKLFSFIGDTVFDPFLGSGSTMIACLKTGRKGIGVDIDKEYCKLAKNRILNEIELIGGKKCQKVLAS